MTRELEISELPQSATPPSSRWAKAVRLVMYPFRRGETPAKQAATGFYNDTTVCIGCKACEVACKQWNQLPADGMNFTGNSYDHTGTLSAESWRHVKFIEQFPSKTETSNDGRVSLNLVQPPAEGNRWLMMSDVCKHCEAAPCEHACPTGAILYNEFSNVYIQADICNGCAYCIAACPFGVITRSHFDGRAHKCTLCYDRQKDGLVPACAKACPTASIQFGPIDELRQRAEKRVGELRERGLAKAHLYGDVASDRYSGLNSFYLLIDKPETYGLPSQPVNPWTNMKGDYVRTVASGLLALAAIAAILLGVGH
ncbi:MAG: 4Fe-4S dicluster domain-containing protein [Gemmataceae bacterium]|nr:4Fe-4S dicluster domain-containing protein [Gemmataceae bacterium]